MNECNPTPFLDSIAFLMSFKGIVLNLRDCMQLYTTKIPYRLQIPYRCNAVPKWWSAVTDIPTHHLIVSNEILLTLDLSALNTTKLDK